MAKEEKRKENEEKKKERNEAEFAYRKKVKQLKHLKSKLPFNCESMPCNVIREKSKTQQPN